MVLLVKEEKKMINDLRVKEFSKDEARMLNPLQLALIGDGVYEVFIRNYILSNNISLLSLIHISEPTRH